MLTRTISIKHYLQLALLLIILLLGIVPNIAAQESVFPQLTVVAPGLNVRSGPGVGYPAIEVLLKGAVVDTINYNSNIGWWQIELSDGRSGWISGGVAYVAIKGNEDDFVQMQSAMPVSQTALSTRSAPKSGNSLIIQTSSGGPIYAINADGTNLRYLTWGIDPALSPDGQWVAFTRWNGGNHGALGNVWLINIDGTGERVIHNDVRQPKSPMWSTDGSQILINMQHGGWTEAKRTCGHARPPRNASDIIVEFDSSGSPKFCYTLPPNPFWGLRAINIATGNFEDLPHDEHSFSPTWDPAKPWRMVYDGDRGLVSLNLNDGSRWALTNDVNDHSPVFSPDGSKIAVSYQQHDHWDIHLLNADGSGRTQLTKTSLHDITQQRLNGQTPRSWNNVAPTWSPDGTQIAFLTDRNGTWQVWVMDANGKNQRPLFAEGALDGLILTYNNVDERMLSWQ